jgi:hypothetical protein
MGIKMKIIVAIFIFLFILCAAPRELIIEKAEFDNVRDNILKGSKIISIDTLHARNMIRIRYISNE